MSNLPALWGVTPQTIRIGLGQMLARPGQPDENLAPAEDMIRAAAQQCHLVVLPECLDFGWTGLRCPQQALPIPGAYSERLAQAARRWRVYVVAGLLQRSGEKLYNAAVLLDPTGKFLLHHRKISLLDIEQELYAVGDRLGVCETALGTIGIDICADKFSPMRSSSATCWPAWVPN